MLYDPRNVGKAVKRCFSYLILFLAVNDYLAASKTVPDWFVTSKMINKLFTDLHADENTLYFNEDSSNVTFSCNEMGFLV